MAKRKNKKYFTPNKKSQKLIDNIRLTGKAAKMAKKSRRREQGQTYKDLQKMLREFEKASKISEKFYHEIKQENEIKKFYQNKYIQKAAKSKNPNQQKQALKDLQEMDRIMGGITTETRKKAAKDLKDYIKGDYYRSDESKVEYKALSMHSVEFEGLDLDRLTDEMVLDIQRAHALTRQKGGAFGVKYHEGLFDALIVTRLKLGKNMKSIEELILKAEENYIKAENNFIPAENFLFDFD